MDIQKMFDAMSAMDRNTRGNYHVTVGSLITALTKADGALPVVFDDGTPVGDGNSYRGYYEDFALRDGDKDSTVAELLTYMREKVLGQEFYGYKGGDFIMGEDTPLWRASYGSCGPAIVDAKEIGGKLVLITKEVD